MSGSEIKIFELNNTHHYHDDNFRFSLDKTKKNSLSRTDRHVSSKKHGNSRKLSIRHQ